MIRANVIAFLLAAGLSTSSLAQQTPYSGIIQIPGTWEAENFDNGGEGIAYHDNTPNNQGLHFRPTEDVDIIQGAGFVVNNFETGEWLEYTVNVPAAGFYNIEILSANSNWTPTPVFRIEIEGSGDVTGAISVPNTGSWSSFQWVGKNGVYLTAGQKVLRIVAVQQYFNLDSIRVTTAPSPAPYGGTPTFIPGTFEVENFDSGGEGVAYHDKVSGNAGGQFRTGEDVDIFVSNDPLGGAYVVKNFETGEWLNFTINVEATGNYDFELRVATDVSFPNRAYRLYVDGMDVTGRVELPETGGWSTYQWAGKKTLALTAGTHALRIVSDQQYFDMNQIRITPTPLQTNLPANLLFWSGFEGATAIGAPFDCYGTGCWQKLTSTDSSTSFTWPPSVWGGNDGRFQLLVQAQVDATTVSTYMVNQMQSGAGRNSTRALYSEIKKSGCCGTNPQGGGATQDPYMLRPSSEPPGAAGNLYISYWLKFQPNLSDLMVAASYPWRVFFEWKTSGDYRVIASIKRDPYINGGDLFWSIQGDNIANGGLPAQVFWRITHTATLVPVNQWFKFEVFWHRSGDYNNNGGRVWMAVNGQVIADASSVTLPTQNTSMMGVNLFPIDRIMINQLYSSTSYPIFQWLDDLQIWQDFPTAAPSDSWYDPPYASH